MTEDMTELTEPKQEPEDEDERTSPLIRVCDTPSSTRSLQSPSGEKTSNYETDGLNNPL